MKRFGGMVAVELDDAAAVHALVQNAATCWSRRPASAASTRSVDRRARWGDPVGEGFARISLGIEDTDDLIADIERALR